MEVIKILKSEYLSILFGGLAAIVTAWITQRVLNKRGVFGYFVTHDRVGMNHYKQFQQLLLTLQDLIRY